jgi:hypothetical protein
LWFPDAGFLSLRIQLCRGEASTYYYLTMERKNPEMLTLLDFLEKAPRKIISRLYRNRNPGTGLVRGKDAVKTVYQETGKTEKISEVLAKLQQWKKSILAAVYLSENRGLSENEFYHIGGQGNMEEMSRFLHMLENNLLVYFRKSDEYTVHGFREFIHPVLDKTLPPADTESDDPGEWMGCRYFLSSHLMHFLGQVSLEKVKVTQKGEMHRKNRLALKDSFSFGNSLSSALGRGEVEFLFQFLLDEDCLLEHNGCLLLADKGESLARKDTIKVERAVFCWWHDRRMCSAAAALEKLSATYAPGIRIEKLCNLLWFYSGPAGLTLSHSPYHPESARGLTWEQLPVVIREMWYLGILHLFFQRGKIFSARFDNDYTRQLLSNTHSNSAGSCEPISLPNFETLLPPDTPTRQRYLVELLAEKLNDENLTRYRFTKESVIAGLQTGLDYRLLQETVQWLNLDSSSRRILEEWAACYQSSSFLDVLVLKITESRRLHELKTMPQFLELTREIIPGFGFIIPRRNKNAVRDFLHQFDLFPGDKDASRIHALPFVPEKEHMRDISSRLEYGPVQYLTNGASSMVTSHTNLKGRYASAPKNPSLLEKSKIVEYAVLTEKKVELSFVEKDRRRILIRPLHIIKKEGPVKVIATEIQTGHRNQYILDEVTSLRVIE